MAVNESRNLNDNLAAGLTDGIVKKIAPDWGGVDRDVYATRERNDQLASYYDMVTWGQSSHIDRAADRYRKLDEKPKPYDFDSPPLSVGVVDTPLVP